MRGLAIGVAAALLSGGVAMAQPNTLTATEKAAGWTLLFDGKSTAGWRTYGRTTADWKVVDGALAPDPKTSGDLITDARFGSFELSFEWKISAKGNSGVMYHVVEGPARSYHSGPEYQVLDNSRGEPPLQRAGALYDLYAPSVDATKPVGEFNTGRIIVKGSQVEHWLNGQKVAEYDLASPDFKAKVAGSKFKAWPTFAANPSGHIALQNHGDDVWFRSVKVRAIK